MQKFFKLLSFSILLIAACGKDHEGEKTTQGEAPPRQEDVRAQLDSPEFKKFKDAFTVKFAGYNSLSPETLYQVVEAVPEQTVTWSCGLVQSNMARASASIALGLPVDKEDVSKCNVKGSYPLLVDIEATGIVLTILKASGVKVEDLDVIDGKPHFRVGALPSNLPNYLNSKLPKGMQAMHSSSSTLSKAQLINVLQEQIRLGMPILVLYSVGNLNLHYYSVVGYHESDNKFLVLDTSGKGIDRFRTFDADQFVAAMNITEFKELLKILVVTYLPLATATKLQGVMPEVSEIDNLPLYNFITFQKR